jgi:hypothetical protein
VSPKKTGEPMRMMDMHDNAVIEMSSIERWEDSLMVQAKAYGAMPMTLYIKPEEMWKAKGLLSWPVVRYFPRMMIRGWWRSRKKSK